LENLGAREDGARLLLALDAAGIAAVDAHLDRLAAAIAARMEAARPRGIIPLLIVVWAVLDVAQIVVRGLVATQGTARVARAVFGRCILVQVFCKKRAKFYTLFISSPESLADLIAHGLRYFSATSAFESVTLSVKRRLYNNVRFIL
jgi:hypothetical protein